MPGAAAPGELPGELREFNALLRPLTGFKGPTSNGRREEKGRGRGWERDMERAGERWRGSPPPPF